MAAARPDRIESVQDMDVWAADYEATCEQRWQQQWRRNKEDKIMREAMDKRLTRVERALLWASGVVTATTIGGNAAVGFLVWVYS